MTNPDCIHCRAIVDGKALFLHVERYAKRNQIDPEAMQRALVWVLGAWTACVLGCLAEEDGKADVDADVRALVGHVELRIREAVGHSGPVTPAFLEETAAMLARADHDAGLHAEHGKA